MGERISKLSESPCYKCGKDKECMAKIKRNGRLWEIRDEIRPNKDFDFNKCGIYISLTCGELIETDG